MNDVTMHVLLIRDNIYCRQINVIHVGWFQGQLSILYIYANVKSRPRLPILNISLALHNLVITLQFIWAVMSANNITLITTPLLLSHYLRQGDYACGSTGLFVCVSVSNNSKKVMNRLR